MAEIIDIILTRHVLAWQEQFEPGRMVATDGDEYHLRVLHDNLQAAIDAGIVSGIESAGEMQPGAMSDLSISVFVAIADTMQPPKKKS